mmetsp:Transcript_52422/g.126887  ORF Transcript_52422/g.126887 Transcript_52422/m.126887 type:complete len:1184 (+) Transcript_52422:261-3812(+)
MSFPPPPPPPPGRNNNNPSGFPGAPPPPPPGPGSAGGGMFPPPPGGSRQPPPPPGGSGAPGGVGMNQVTQGMAGMGFHPPPQQHQQRSAPPPPHVGGGFGPPPGGPGAPPPPPAPGNFQAPPAPGMFQPPPGSAPAPSVAQVGRGFQAPPPPGPPSAPATPGLVGPPGGPAPPGPGGMQRTMPAPPGGMLPGAPGMQQQQQQPQQLYQENIDFNIKIPDRLFRLTCDKIPQTNQVAASSRVPLGGILRPLAPCPDGEEDVDTVQPGQAGIIRCKRCRTYINAFVHWVEHGRRWRCNICGQMNDTPAAYFCHLDDQGLRRDRFERPELSKGVVEFIAPAEYMVRPPQEPSYFFVLDVSATAVRCGMLHSAAQAIKRSLDDLPGGQRTKVGFITFDNSVQYYNLASDLSQPQMLVVSDLKELFVPLPDNLLVNLAESRSVVDAFLDSLPEMFVKNPVVSQSCLGPALKAAFTVMKQIGGKMCVFQSIQPNLGDGALKPRENQSFMGTNAEMKLLRPDLPWYKDTAIEFSRQQISVDMFLFPYAYMDLSALGELPKLTSGSMHSYVMFNYEKDGPRFEEQLNKVLVQETAFEAVMRIRCTKGMRITNFYGNFYIRGTDLMALPNVNSESIFGFDLAHDEVNIASNYVTMQAALLYTSSEGQRRIRVMTQAIPVTTLTSDLIKSVDVFPLMNLLSKQGVDVASKTNLDNARMRMQQTCVELIRAAKGGDRRMVSGYAVPQAPQSNEGEEDDSLPESLQLFPLYTLALMKNVAFRGGTDVHPDERVQAWYYINQMWLDRSKPFIYPRLFSLHDMDPDAGYPVETDQLDELSDDLYAGRSYTRLPQALPLTIESLSSNGLYLLDNGVEFGVWVGREAPQHHVQALFGVPSLDNYDANSLKIQTEGDEFAVRIGSIVNALRDSESDTYPVSSKINIVREGDSNMEARFFWFMVEDPASFQGGTYSYEDFMKFVQNPNAGPGAPPGPSGPGMQRGPPAPGGGGYGAPPPPGRGMAPPQAGYGQQTGPPMPPQGQPQMSMQGQGPPPPQPPMGQRGPPQQAPYSGGMPQPSSQAMGAPQYPPQYGGPPSGGAPPPPVQSTGPPPPAYSNPQSGGAPPRPAQRAPPPPPGRGGHPPPPKMGGMAPPPPGRPSQGNGANHSAPPPPPGPPRGRAPPPPPGPPRGRAPPPPPPPR